MSVRQVLCDLELALIERVEAVTRDDFARDQSRVAQQSQMMGERSFRDAGEGAEGFISDPVWVT